MKFWSDFSKMVVVYSFFHVLLSIATKIGAVSSFTTAMNYTIIVTFLFAWLVTNNWEE